jgi:hypothetical protein
MWGYGGLNRGENRVGKEKRERRRAGGVETR